ncbi:MAG TPA: mannosyltransferase family protein [Actinomycetota bacterium]|nr:mannosyltransferase family protein [Actinomycetota bacterium]
MKFVLRPRVRTAARIVLLQRLLFAGAGLLIAWFLAPGLGRLTDGVLDVWDRLDASRFARIAEHGYDNPDDPHAAAYFPLVPMVMAAARAMRIEPIAGAMIVNTVAALVAFVYLYRLVEEEFDAETARRALWYLAFFPTAVFLVAPYSEPLFLAGAIPAFYYARRQRWHLVGLPAAIACTARFAGVFLLIGLIAEFLRQRSWRPRRVATAAVALATGALPIAVFFLYLWRVTGSPARFFEAQRDGWGRIFVGPVRSFGTTWETWTGSHFFTNQLIAWRVEIVAAALGVALVVWAALKREWGYAAYMGSMHAALVTSSWYYSIPRAMLTMFPAVIFLAAHTVRKPKRHEPLLAVFASIAMFGVIVYTRGHWFF